MLLGGAGSTGLIVLAERRQVAASLSAGAPLLEHLSFLSAAKNPQGAAMGVIPPRFLTGTPRLENVLRSPARARV
jgi:hypothetical protein